MKLQFLCQQHKHWLQNEPEQALSRCLQAYETGRLLYSQGCYRRALSYAGCSYEMAQIILEHQSLPISRAIDWLVATSKALILSLQNNYRYADGIVVYEHTQKLFEELQLIYPELADSMLEHMTRLQRDVFNKSMGASASINNKRSHLKLVYSAQASELLH